MNNNNKPTLDYDLAEILSKAIEEKTVQSSVILKIAGNDIEVFLSSADSIPISRKHVRISGNYLREYKELGFDKEPINEKQWNATLSKASKQAKEDLEKSKPSNKAEQLASQDAMMDIILEIIPSKLKDKNGNLFFVKDKLELFKTLVLSDKEIFKAVLDVFVGLNKESIETSKDINKKVKQAKN